MNGEDRWAPGPVWTEFTPGPDSTAIMDVDEPLPARRPVGFAPSRNEPLTEVAEPYAGRHVRE